MLRTETITAYIALGSNIECRIDHINTALARIMTIPTTEILRHSSIIETRPQGGPEGQNRYLNGVIEISTRQGPLELLSHLLNIETALGRVRNEKWGPRTIDLDILLYNKDIINYNNLTIPHKQMHKRLFVMEPIAQIAPSLIHPLLNKTMSQIYSELKITEGN